MVLKLFRRVCEADEVREDWSWGLRNVGKTGQNAHEFCCEDGGFIVNNMMRKNVVVYVGIGFRTVWKTKGMEEEFCDYIVDIFDIIMCYYWEGWFG